MEAAEPSPTKPPSPPVSKLSLLVAVVAAVGILGVILYKGFDEPPPVPPPTKIKLSLDDTLRLESLKWQAIALLENARIDEAEATFKIISLTLPDDEVVLRNIAIGRVLRLDSDKSDEAIQAAADAIERLAATHPNSGMSYWLLSKQREVAKSVAPFEEQSQIRSSQLMALEYGAQRDPSVAFYRYGTYKASKEIADDDAAIDRAQTSLLEALKIEPDNIFLLLEALDVLRLREDARFGDTAKRLQKILEPLREGLGRKVRNSDPFKVLDEAIQAADAGNWKSLQRYLISIGWIKNDDVAQSDRRRVDPHPLEFVAREFTSAELTPIPPPAATDTPIPFQGQSLKLNSDNFRKPVAAAWGDADLDEVVDLWVVSQGTNPDHSHFGIFERNADNDDRWDSFAEVELPIPVKSILLADLDRDDKQLQTPRPGHPLPADKSSIKEADLDAVLYGPGGIRIVTCETDPATGQRSLKVLNQPDGLDKLVHVTAATLGDFDHDGDLDLCIAALGSLQIWINRENGVFDDVSRWSIPPAADGLFTSLAAVDIDRDVDIDIVAVGRTLGSVGIFENLRHLNFRWRDAEHFGLQLPESSKFSDVRVMEVDGNASWDLALADDDAIHLALSDTPVAGAIKFRKPQRIFSGGPQRILNADFDNDSQQDLAIVSEPGLWTQRGLPDSQFSIARAVGDAPLSPSPTSLDAADIDRDGKLDLVCIGHGEIYLLKNDSPNQFPWVNVEVRGIEEAISGRVNYLGIGSVVEMRCPSGKYQAQLVQNAVTHFGLGQDDHAEVARVLFTNGIPQSMVRPTPRQVVRETQKQLGSCPYCYAWNGQEYAFVTDLLWAAPIGLVTAEGHIMPDRPWEYLKLDGHHLQPRDGHYELLLTEELWEAGYFDQVELLAVDHPADVEIYSNEKVGPPDLATFKIHTVRQRRSPVAARDSAGNDVLPALRTRDNQFAQCFQKTYRQGLAETHFLELDLGQIPDAKQITLFLTGWIRPTDTSLNLALFQNSQLDGPRPPRMLVPTPDGAWREALPFMGFPGGKTKTVAIDLTGVLALPDGRLRIETSAELRWDEAFFTVDEQPVEYRTQPLALHSAELRYGGYSKRIESTTGGPDTFDRKHLAAPPEWPPMRGAFTRFGDVRELLLRTDDQLAVIGAGDEIFVRFTAPDPPPPGWKRDFILHNVGWDKDCALNTLLGQTVEPLPFQAMQSYPYDSVAYPDSPAMRDYLRNYQTRQQPFHEFWKQLSAPPRNR